MLYFAYGMNTNTQGMTTRCPGAVAFGRARLLGHRFRFAGPADVQVDRRSDVDGVLWDLTEDCLRALDALEGFPWYYDRKYATVDFEGEQYQALVYFMQPGHKSSPPSSSYFSCVLEGYEEFAVPQKQLWENVTQSTTFLPY